MTVSTPSYSISVAYNLFRSALRDTSQSLSQRTLTIDEEKSGEDYGYLSDSDLEDDEDEKVASFKRKGKSTKGHPFNPFAKSTVNILGKGRL